MMKEINKYVLSVAGIVLQMETDQHLLMNEEFLPFLTSKIPDFKIYFQKIEQLPKLPLSIAYEDYYHRVHVDGFGKFLFSFFDAPRDGSPYAVVRCDYEKKEIYVDYLEQGSRCVSELRNCFSHVMFEEILLQRQRLYLHAACVSTALGGILFTGYSGAGKSTQAELWNEYRQAEHINGDRTILQKSDAGWFAWGSPYAGSSKYHLNKMCQVSAIVLVKQEKTCSVRKLNPLEAFKSIWSELTIYSWDSEFVDRASSLLLDAIKEIPVYELCCTPDERAVVCLEQELRKECGL